MIYYHCEHCGENMGEEETYVDCGTIRHSYCDEAVVGFDLDEVLAERDGLLSRAARVETALRDILAGPEYVAWASQSRDEQIDSPTSSIAIEGKRRYDAGIAALAAIPPGDASILS